MINVAGDGFNQLSGPYDAKEIGDFTGLTAAVLAVTAKGNPPK